MIDWRIVVNQIWCRIIELSNLIYTQTSGVYPMSNVHKFQSKKQKEKQEKKENSNPVTPTILVLMLLATAIGTFYRGILNWQNTGEYTHGTFLNSINGFGVVAVLILLGSFFANKMAEEKRKAK